MLNSVLQFLLDVFVQGFAAVLLLRFLLQWLRAPLRNPAGETVMSLTNFIVLHARRYVPSVGTLDTTTLLLAFLVEALYLAISLALQGTINFSPLGLLLLSVVNLLVLSVYFLIGALIAQAVLSWINPYTPIAPLLQAMTQRFLQPLQRVIPPLGNIDLSPLFLLVICQLILRVPLALLEHAAERLL